MAKQEMVDVPERDAVVYLHDIRETTDGLSGANLSNADLLSDVETYLEESGKKVLTADDGYRSVRLLLPLLERTGARLVLFLTTGFLDRTVFPYEIVASNMVSTLPRVQVFGEEFDTGSDPEAREAAFKRVHRALKPQSYKRRVRLIDRLAAENNTTKEQFVSDVFLSWDEAAELAGHSQIDIGAHSHRHLHLPDVGKRTQLYELLFPRLRLARRLRTPVTSMAYPYGGENARVQRYARACGYRSAFGTSPESAGPYARPRQTLTDALNELSGHQ
ncbi:polysaccharide deacetylase family protein [uncultured Roseobacter sp.]|uniref:polysaccharide deacetylase family protein n=1 Tax=uncultured Roseobacter sp. TaxID=114847 RepID=UPI00261F8EB2|nr:polysaccharide deacetylase family protein [uncultured Roseobacter sp.]